MKKIKIKKESIKIVIFTVLYLFIISSFYPLFMYFNNISEVNILEVMPIILLYCIISVLIYCLIFIVTKKRELSLLSTLLFILFIVNFSFLKKILFFIISDLNYWHVILIGLILIIHIILFILKKLSSDIINIMCLSTFIMFSGLLTFNFVIAVPTIINKISIDFEDNTIISFNSEDVFPNIYYLLVDEYSSTEVMDKYYNYDNSWFDTGLENLGFTVFDNTMNNSISTHTVVANYMNYDYVVNDSVPLENRSKYKENGELLYFLLEKNYKLNGIGNSEFIGIESLTHNNKDESKSITGESLAEIIYSNSIFYPFFNMKEDGRKVTIINAFDYFKNSNNYNKLNNTFTAMYLVSPHEPFLFDLNGNDVQNGNMNNWENPKYYREQHNYISQKLLDTVANIQKYDSNAVILLQSDHGARFYEPIPLDEQKKVLNALYIPNSDLINVESTTGVNTIRTMLNIVFDMNLEEVKYEE